ncbi:MAG: bifunctional riboflavin kinase/FAD synthetase [Gammaproteobacteria bacterium]|nr:bifunctional riboflavin kinase/FAD synthetase [Gammaproteobacteria bacterium]
MQLIRGFKNRRDLAGGSVATIGNFDGVHKGHQAILEKLQARSSQLGLPSMVVTFEPSANELFLGNQAPPRLTNLREKFRLIENMGINFFVCLTFDQTLASVQPEAFVQDILIGRLNVRYLTVGDDFRFGKNRTGDYELLRSMSAAASLGVENTQSVVVDGERVRSSSIRDYLAAGRLDLAESLLGRAYSMSGRVIRGDRKGRTLGFPTANIPIKRRFSPVNGVFAVRVKLENGNEKLGIANVGHRPTLAGTRTLIEVHLFNFSQDIYFEHLTVFFCKKIRAEKKFGSLDDLKNQIHLDSEYAREYFGIPA